MNAEKGMENRYNDDEIDLFELIEGLWQQKWLIVICTLVALGLGAAYAFLTPPTYEAKTHLLPPTSKDTVELRQPNSIKQFSPEEVYNAFISTLQSNQAKREFLAQPDVLEYFAQFSDSTQVQWRTLNNALSVAVPSKPPINNVSVAFKLQQSDIAAEFANRYVELATELTRNQLANDLRAEIESKVEALELQIANRKSLYISQLDTELRKLNEALGIAKQIGQESPLQSDIIIDDKSVMMVDEVRKLYRLGSRALEAEISAINQRRESEAFIPDLMQLEQQLSLLQSMAVNESRITPATIDLQAEAPESPIKPKKALILALSVVLGGMLGVFAALIRGAIRKRKAAQTA